MNGRKTIYMDHASVGRPAPSTIEAVRDAATKLLEYQGTGTELTLGLIEEVEEARKAVSRLLAVPAESVALVENTTQALGLLATSIPLEAGDNVIVPDIDFLSAALVWRPKAERAGIEVRPVKTSAGRVTIEDFARAINSRTRVVMTSVVQEVSGDRIDLEALMELCELHGAYLIVDGIQEVGVLRRDLSRTPIHAYCSGGHKWLGSPFGLGFMYLHPDLLEACVPSFYGYFNLREPEEGWGPYLESRERGPFDDLPPSCGARVFESGGMPNWLGAVGLRWAVENILERGLASIESHALRLSEHLRNGLGRLGLGEHLLGRDAREHRSAIVTFSLPGGLHRERSLLRTLEEEQVFVSLRSASGVGGLRVLPYVGNTLEDIDLLLEITKSQLKEA